MLLEVVNKRLTAAYPGDITLNMDLTSLPGSPWDPTPRHIKEQRASFAKSADLLRIAGKFIPAEKLYLRAAENAEGGAVVHLQRLADQCRAQFEQAKKCKKRAKNSKR